MAGNKTRDGLKLNRLVKALLALPGGGIREDNKHPYIASIMGHARLCPIATSTDARRMIVPWIRETTSYKDSTQIYRALKTGDWNYE